MDHQCHFQSKIEGWSSERDLVLTTIRRLAVSIILHCLINSIFSFLASEEIIPKKIRYFVCYVSRQIRTPVHRQIFHDLKPSFHGHGCSRNENRLTLLCRTVRQKSVTVFASPILITPVRIGFLQEEDLVETLDDIGYSAQVQDPESSAERSFRHVIARFRIQGMTCSTCVGVVEHALTAVRGVTRAAVALATAEAEVEYDSRWAGNLLMQSTGVMVFVSYSSKKCF